MKQNTVIGFLAVLWGLMALPSLSCAPQPRLLGDPLERAIRTGMKSGTKTFDHSDFGKILGRFVRAKDGAVDYTALKKNPADLQTYLDKVAGVKLTDLGRAELLALLINAYNAYTLQLILDHYPGIQSIRDISSPWDTKKYSIGGHIVSLNQIEHNLIRPLFQDARIHFAVNCASIGCPRLWQEPFEGKLLEKQLEDVTRKTMSNPRYVKLEENSLKVSKIMDWYRSDFETPESTLKDFLARYAPEAIQKWLASNDSIGFLDYDWKLNSQ